jgi:hypothetical protein
MRLRALAVPLTALALAGPIACGDDSSSERNASETQPATTSAPEPTGRRPRQPEEYKGVYATTKEVCGATTRKKVASNVGSHSTRREDIARAVANGYKPKLRKQAYRGCLAGLE